MSAAEDSRSNTEQFEDGFELTTNSVQMNRLSSLSADTTYIEGHTIDRCQVSTTSASSKRWRSRVVWLHRLCISAVAS